MQLISTRKSLGLTVFPLKNRWNSIVADFDEIWWVGRVFITESHATNFNKKIVRVNGFSVENPLEFFFADFDEIWWVGRVFITEFHATDFNKTIVRVNGFSVNGCSVEKPLTFIFCRFFAI